MTNIIDKLYEKLEKSHEHDNIEALFSSFTTYLKGTAYVSFGFFIFVIFFLVIIIINPGLSIFGQNYQIQRFSDFSNYLEASRSMLSNRLDLIYNEEYMTARGFGVFHCFPSMLVVFLPFLSMSYPIAYFLFAMINVLLTFYTNYLVTKIIVKLKLPAMQGFTQALSMLFIFFNFEFIFQGEITGIIIVILLNAMLKLLEGKDFQGALLIGICTFFKPITLILIFVLLLSATRFKTVARYMIGIILPLVPDIIIFISNPGLLIQYLSVNYNVITPGFIDVPSCDVLSIIAEITMIPWFLLFIAFMVIGVILASRILPKINDRTWKIVFTFVFSAAIYQISQPLITGSQMILIYPFVILSGSLIMNKESLSRFRAWFMLYQASVYSAILLYLIVSSISTNIYLIAFSLSALTAIVTTRFIWTYIKPTIIFTINPKIEQH